MSHHLTIEKLWALGWEARWKHMSSAKSAKSMMVNVLRHMGSTRITTLSVQRLERYADEREMEDAAPSTINRELGILRGVLNWGLHQTNGSNRPLVPPAKMPTRWPLRQENGKERCLSPSELERLLAALNPWAADLVTVLVNTGARCQEILNARVGRYEAASETGALLLSAEEVKEREAKTIALNDVALEVVRRRLRAISGWPRQPGRLFARTDTSTYRADYQALWKALRAASDEVGIVGVSPHDLRRTFASTALRAGAPLEAVAQALGHRSMQTTRRYARLDTGSKRSVADLVSRVLTE